MEDLKNDIQNNINEEEKTIESEEVLEVAMADENEVAADEEHVLTANYTEFERSGLTEQQRKRKMIIDKITTGILILLMASPVLIVIYILLWFVLK